MDFVKKERTKSLYKISHQTLYKLEKIARL